MNTQNINPTQLKSPVSTRGVLKFVLPAVLLWIVATITAYAATIPSDALWFLPLMEAITYICNGLAILVVAAGLGTFVVKAVQMYAPGLFNVDINLNDVQAHAQDTSLDRLATQVDRLGQNPQITQQMKAVQIPRTLQGLGHILAAIEKDSSQAAKLVQDAEEYTAVLVDLIKAIVHKAEGMELEREHLTTASAAIRNRDEMEIAQAAGLIRDNHVREMMLAEINMANGYWVSVMKVIATQLGTLKQWEEAYNTYAAQLLTEVSSQKTRLAVLRASIELLETAPAILLIERGLDDAQQLLQLRDSPEAARSVKYIPALSAGRQ